MYVDPSWKDSTTDPNGTVVVQWHGPPDPDEPAHSPQLSIRVTKDNRWRIVTMYDANAKSTSTSPQKLSYDLGSIKKGVWVDWVVHAKWHYNSTGLLEIWKDGTKVVDRDGPNTYNDQTQIMVAFGIYKGWYSREQPSPRDILTIYHDGVRIGDQNSTYADVASKVSLPSTPPPAPSDLQAGINQ
jgi:hypothetical protein